jgi:curved DNA-binding protein CbpA
LQFGWTLKLLCNFRSFRDASFQEIKRAYGQLAIKCRPDRNNSSLAEDIITKINACFEVLSDNDKGVEYGDIVRRMSNSLTLMYRIVKMIKSTEILGNSFSIIV